MGAKVLRRILLSAGAATMVAAMVAITPAAATTPTFRAQGYTWTPVSVPGSVWTEPEVINDLGVVTGWYLGSDDLLHGFVEQGGNYTTVDYPGAPVSLVVGVTLFGEIVGGYGDGQRGGFIDQGGNFTSIQDPYASSTPTSGNYGTGMVGVTPLGKLVGFYYDASATEHGFTYQDGKYTTFDCPGAGTGANEGTSPSYVTSDGAIAGSCSESNGGFYNFIYENGRFNTVPNVPGSSFSEILWATDLGESGGLYVTSAGLLDGYVYQYGRFTTICDPAGPYGIFLAGANDFGQIVGFYLDNSGNQYGFVMTPRL